MALGKAVVILHRPSQENRWRGYRCAGYAEGPVPLIPVDLERFTAFTHFNPDVSPGISVLSGPTARQDPPAEGVPWAACDVSTSGYPVFREIWCARCGDPAASRDV
ncbi:MAG: hypothetical protein TE42_08540 [Candidatus Synechococcus spongiarum SP3]|uniref:Uncharacterized protein n=1 Tax=Candidatus Synechococcus spongiarum SP3 TaxID=1604020 RepID=A0A0G2IVR4_9SYNE|nr:MAG: hypothetical protein TE42_08540 [Candidatus Synechococcus spongiarum SP3]